MKAQELTYAYTYSEPFTCEMWVICDTVGQNENYSYAIFAHNSLHLNPNCMYLSHKADINDSIRLLLMTRKLQNVVGIH
jgi:hypothetical protein